MSEWMHTFSAKHGHEWTPRDWQQFAIGGFHSKWKLTLSGKSTFKVAIERIFIRTMHGKLNLTYNFIYKVICWTHIWYLDVIYLFRYLYRIIYRINFICKYALLKFLVSDQVMNELSDNEILKLFIYCEPILAIHQSNHLWLPIHLLHSNRT